MQLKDWGAEILVRRPRERAGIMSIQHKKSWLFDMSALFFGSANATGNILENCEELNMINRRAPITEQYVAHFDECWESSDEPDWGRFKADFNRVAERAEARAEAKREARAASTTHKRSERLYSGAHEARGLR